MNPIFGSVAISGVLILTVILIQRASQEAYDANTAEPPDVGVVFGSLRGKAKSVWDRTFYSQGQHHSKGQIRAGQQLRVSGSRAAAPGLRPALRQDKVSR